MKKSWKVLLKYGITALVGLAIMLPVAFSRGLQGGLSLALNARYLSDGAFVAGVMVGGVGALVWISDTGFFDMFSYAFKSLLVLFTSLRKPKEHMDFYDYKTMKAEKRGKAPRYIFYVGVCYLLLAAALLATYYNA